MNIFTLIVTCAFPNMNGDVYGISNPNYTDPVKFSTQYYDINSTTEYFEVYSPVITSQYAMVYWTMMPPVPLPENIIMRFQGKKIAIVGYRSRRIFRHNNSPDSSVPITEYIITTMKHTCETAKIHFRRFEIINMTQMTRSI